MNKLSLMATAICLFILFLSSPASADKGMIPVYHVDLEEPEQNAIIGWNGSEEVLILSTNVKASSQTAVVEVLPLPSKPHIEGAEMISFHMVENYVNMKMEPEYPSFGFGQGRESAFHLVSQERIGAHNISVVKINRSEEFVEWFKGFVRQKGYDREVPVEFNQIIGDYVGRGYDYLAIDVINATSEERSVDPILYRFKSDKIYYPLEITAPINSVTEINLFIFSPGIVEEKSLKDYGFRGEVGYEDYIYLSRSELREVSPQLKIMDGAYFVHAKYSGNTQELTRDLEIEEVYVPTPLDSLADYLEDTVVFLSIKGAYSLGDGDSVWLRQPMGMIVLTFSTLLGLPGLFYFAQGKIRNMVSGVERRDLVSYLFAGTTTALTALATGLKPLFLPVLFLLFIFGIYFAVRMYIRVGRMELRTSMRRVLRALLLLLLAVIGLIILVIAVTAINALI